MRLLFAVLAGVAFTLACSGNSSPTSPSSAAGGTLRLMLKDSPYTDAKSVLVTFSEVTAHRAGEGGFTRLPFAGDASSRTCDLKKLVDAQDVLGVGTIPEGHYTQIRLVVSSAALYFDNVAAGPACAAAMAAPAGRSATMEIASDTVRLNREFTVGTSGATTMLVDFDGDKSIHETGNGRYRMSPVISVVSVN
jgi:hypothetical protein